MSRIRDNRPVSVNKCARLLFTCALCVCTCCSLSWIEVNGSTYKQGSVVDGNMPSFGIIEDIVIFTDMYYLVCSVLITECFSHHFHAFKTYKQHPEGYVICKPSALHDRHVLAVYTILSSHALYVPLTYQLVESDMF